MNPETNRSQQAIRRLTTTFDNRIERLYSILRFVIFRQRFLQEIGQYVPERGRVLDIGCGIGLFANYFGQIKPEAFLERFQPGGRYAWDERHG